MNLNSKVWLGAIAALVVIGLVASVEQPLTAPAAPPPSPEKPVPTITMAKYAALEAGMTYSEAVKILGAAGVEQSSNELSGVKTILYTWDSGWSGSMNAMFQNDRLIQKAQHGLK